MQFSCTSRTEDESIDGEVMGLRIRQECNTPTIDINRKIQHRRFRWLGQILALRKTKTIRPDCSSKQPSKMEKPYAGVHLMDALAHESLTDDAFYS